ncbi:MAG: hypothetical protein NT068_00315 [Candidatus Nomurabacteria bacterium]|nr:hypothetical protein [Candidatus Nomurabacteria bacterium]
MPKEKITTSNTADTTEAQIDPLELLKNKWGANNSNSNKNKQNSQKLAKFDKVDNSLPKVIPRKIQRKIETIEVPESLTKEKLVNLGYPKYLLDNLSDEEKKDLASKNIKFEVFMTNLKKNFIKIQSKEGKKSLKNKHQKIVGAIERIKVFEEKKEAGKIMSNDEIAGRLIGSLFPKQELIKQLPDEDIEEWRKYYQEQLKDESLSDEMKERYLKKLKTIREYKEFIDEVEVTKKIIIKKEGEEDEEEILEMLLKKVEAKKREEREKRREAGLLKDLKPKK